jgi:transposase-like protein
MHTMTERKGKSGTIDVKALLAGDEEFLRALVRTALQEVLEVEMAETLGAEKGERTSGRLGYRSGYYGRTLVTRIGKLELRVPQSLPRRRPGTAPVGSRPRCSRAISARSGPW